MLLYKTMFFSHLLDFAQNKTFSKSAFSGVPSKYQPVWIQIRPDKMSGLIWVLKLFAKVISRQQKMSQACKALKVNPLPAECGYILYIHCFPGSPRIHCTQSIC